MSFAFNPKRNVETEFRRIAVEQIQRAIAEIDNTGLSDDDTVHQVRKRCKKLRALYRLARGALGEQYAAGNAHFRDLARDLSGTRDAAVMLETFNHLLEKRGLSPAEERFQALNDLLIRRSLVKAGPEESAEKLANARQKLVDAVTSVHEIQLSASGFDALKFGVKKTYARMRKAMKAAHSSPSDEILHEWRKRVKYHWYQLRLLRKTWRGLLDATARKAGVLADLLGDDHNLAVLAETIRKTPEDVVAIPEKDIALNLIAERRDRLQRKAYRLGEHLVTDKPEAFAKRIGEHWRISAH